MFAGPDITISKRERRKYKSNVAAWEKIREAGMVRFILVRGVLRVGVPVVIAFVAGFSLYNNGFGFYPEVLLDPLNMGLMIVSSIVIGTRWKLNEWLDNEREYKAWKVYKSKGNILNIENQ